MALSYSEVLLNSTGMVSAQHFPLPRDGRRVMFSTNDGMELFKKFFILIDGEFYSFKNGSRMDTPVGALGKFFSSPHEAFVVIVDTRACNISEITIPITPVTVMFPHGKQAVIRFSGKLKASIAAKDPEDLASAYVQGVTSPTHTAEAVFKEAFREAVITEIPDIINNNPTQTINMVDHLSIKLKHIIEYNVERKLPWCTVNTCEVNLTIENIDTLIDEANVPIVFDMETKRTLLTAILSTYGKTPLSPEVASVIRDFIINNPGITTADCINFCKGIQAIYPVTTSADIINATAQVGCTSTKKLGGH